MSASREHTPGNEGQSKERKKRGVLFGWDAREDNGKGW